jgi:hypothetical protein
MNKLKEKFDKFDSDNPHIWDLFKDYTFQAIKAGVKSYGAQAIIERIRWYSQVETKSDDNYKISNSHVAFYARKFMKEFPEHDTFFRIIQTDNHV